MSPIFLLLNNSLRRKYIKGTNATPMTILRALVEKSFKPKIAMNGIERYVCAGNL
jgi:hypothetical protein